MICRIYDTACLNPSYCNARDACCAGDPDCKPMTALADLAREALAPQPLYYDNPDDEPVGREGLLARGVLELERQLAEAKAELVATENYDIDEIVRLRADLAAVSAARDEDRRAFIAGLTQRDIDRCAIAAMTAARDEANDLAEQLAEAKAESELLRILVADAVDWMHSGVKRTVRQWHADRVRNELRTVGRTRGTP